MNINLFKEICQKTQEEVKEYATQELRKTHDKVIVDDGFVFAQGTFPVLLLAHMDTVHKTEPKMFVYDPNKQVLSSPQGIGGDDRCGIYMVLEVIKKYNCSVLFCEDEEIGAVGAVKFTLSKLAQTLKFNYAIEFDRQGSNDAVFYDCDNEEFEEFITKEFYKTTWGSFSDISEVAPALGCAAVNLSCGYYKAHTKDEYVVLPEMEASIAAACKILERTTEENVFEYIEAVHWYKRNGKYDWFDDYDYGYSYGYGKEEQYFLIEYVEDKLPGSQWYEAIAFSEEEAIGRFCMEHPTIPYIDIIDISHDSTWNK